MIWIALAAQLSAPVPQEMWFSVDDTPVEYISNRGFQWLRLRLVIGPQGRLIRCDIEASSGEPRLDKYTCDLTLKRARFTPAQNADGTPAYGVFRVPVIWAMDPVDVKMNGDVALTVNRLPEGVRSPVKVSVAVAVDKRGQVSLCDGQPPPSFADAPPNNPALVTIACSWVLKKYIASPATDEKGDPVSSVQTASVVFTKE